MLGFNSTHPGSFIAADSGVVGAAGPGNQHVGLGDGHSFVVSDALHAIALKFAAVGHQELELVSMR